MDTDISTLLTFPDEILLEIYKYLLNAHVLYSFHGINKRLNRSITDYCRHISLTDITYEQSHHLYRSIIPEIGYKIQSISISNCRSILQGKLFAQYFSDRMPKIFPNLHKLTLISFAGDELDRFLSTLTDLNNLEQIEIYDLLSNQPDLLQHIADTNNNRFNSITFETSYSNLPACPCLNILNLTITIRTLDKLSHLLSVIPNACRLNVTIDEISLVETRFDHLSPLLRLNYLFLRCYNHLWLLAEVHSLFEKLPVIENLFLQLSSQDKRFVNSEQALFNILPRSIQQFNLSLRYLYDSIEEIDQNALSTSRFPMTCLIDENLEQARLHTLPYRFPLFNISVPMSKQMSTYNNYRNVRMFYDYEGMTLAEAFPIISRCRRIKEICIQLFHNNDESPSVQQQPQLPPLPNLFYLKRLWLLHSSREYQSLKFLLQMAPNLSELFIAFDNLQPIFDDQDTCQLLQNRISHLLILRSAPTAPRQITEEYIPHLARIFTRLRHLQIDVTDGPPIESIILSVMNVFKTPSQLISLVVEGQSSSNELKSNTRQWVIENTHLTIDGKFDAEFKSQTNRFLLWM